MSSNPINLAFRFALELAALVAMGAWGAQKGQGVFAVILAIGVPLMAAALWGIFRIPNDPGRAPVAVPGLVRLALEAIYFAFAVWALFNIGSVTLGVILGIAVILHYALSYDRVIRLGRG